MMEYVGWAVAGAIGLYLFHRWVVLADIRSELAKVAEERAQVREALSHFDEIRRKLTAIEINILSLRRKLGFDSDWAESRHIEDQIAALQSELNHRNERSIA